MAQTIGSMYHIGKVPIRLYWGSDRAAARNAAGGGWVNQVGNYKIINRAWDNNGKPAFSDPGGGAIPLYAINDITNSYAIGWIRDDDNITKGTLTNVPSSLSSEASSFKIGINKMHGSSYTLKIEVNGQQWVNHSGSSDNYTHTMTDASKDKLYSAMWNLTNATARVTLETVYNGQHLGTDTATINISIPASIKPTFTTPPEVSVYGAVSDKNYAGIGGMQITNAPGWQPGRGAISAPHKVTVTNMSSSGTNKWTFNNPGQAKLTYTITDSRGRSTSMEWTQTVEDTQPISVDSFTAKRSGSTGATFEANGMYMASIDGTPTYQIKRRERGTSNRESTESGTASVSNGRWSVSRTVPTGYISNKSYDIQILVAGTSTNASAQSVLGTEAVPISFGKHGSGVGTMFDNSNPAMLQVGIDGIDSEGPIKTEGKVDAIGYLLNGQSFGGMEFLEDAIKFDSGLLIRFGVLTTTYHSFQHTFPTDVPFIEPPFVMATAQLTAFGQILNVRLTSVNEVSFALNFFDANGARFTNQSYDYRYIAIGRWK